MGDLGRTCSTLFLNVRFKKKQFKRSRNYSFFQFSVSGNTILKFYGNSHNFYFFSVQICTSAQNFNINIKPIPIL